jgi:hypothetical protein
MPAQCRISIDRRVHSDRAQNSALTLGVREAEFDVDLFQVYG